jgi:hypothetical protein
VHAQVPSESDPETRARALFEAATRAREAGDWLATRRLLSQSLEAFPRFPTAWNLATASERTDDLSDAERILERIRDGEFGELDPEQRRSVASRLDAIAPRLATLNLAVPREIDHVEVDRGEVPRVVDAPGRLRLRLSPGNHEVAITLPSGARVERSVELQAGASVRLRLREPPPSGRLIVESYDPETDLLIEGVARGVGRLVLSLPPDEYRVRAPDRDEVRVIRLGAGETERIYFDRPQEVWESPWLWTGLSLLVIGAVLAPVLYFTLGVGQPLSADFEAPPL